MTNIKGNSKKVSKGIANKNLSRKEWLAKAGKYTIFTAASMMLILGPGQRLAAQSAGSDPANAPSGPTWG